MVYLRLQIYKKKPTTQLFFKKNISNNTTKAPFPTLRLSPKSASSVHRISHLQALYSGAGQCSLTTEKQNLENMKNTCIFALRI